MLIPYDSRARFSKWAIRVKGTNLYLPEIKYHRGYTHYDPEPDGGALGPRLLRSRRAAINALAAYCQGIWFRDWNHGNPIEGNDSYDFPNVKPDTQRSKADFEIVEFEVIEFLPG